MRMRAMVADRPNAPFSYFRRVSASRRPQACESGQIAASCRVGTPTITARSSITFRMGEVGGRRLLTDLDVPDGPAQAQFLIAG